MTTEILNIQGTDVLKEKTPSIINTAQALIVFNDKSNQTAIDYINVIRGFRKEIKNTFGEPIKKEKEALRALEDLKNSFDKPLADVEMLLRERSENYKREEDARRERLQAKIQADAERENKKNEKQAKKEGIVAPPVVIPTPVIQKVAANGANYRLNYKAKIKDFKTLVNAVAAGLAPLECLEPNETMLNAMSRARKKEGELYPGVECVAEQILVGKRL